jgi:hypothetical protein
VDREKLLCAWSRVYIYMNIRQEFSPNSSCEKFRGGGSHLKLCIKFSMFCMGIFLKIKFVKAVILYWGKCSVRYAVAQ